MRRLAVLGLGGRFPGANDLDTYWRNILADVCSIRPLPPERFHKARYYHPEKGTVAKSYSAIGGVIEAPPFDGTRFRIPPKVAENTDIAQLWALEVAEATLADAGIDPGRLAKGPTGVFLGHARGSMLGADISFGVGIEGVIGALDEVGVPPNVKSEVVSRIHQRYPSRGEDGSVGTIASALAGRIAGHFGFTGRHLVVDAACASSFAALDAAAGAIECGAIDYALVGGASYSQELSMVVFAMSQALSPDGSFPFDRRANGFISSDGYGFLLVTALDRALAEGHRIRAVISAIGGSCDGKGKGLWAPRKEGQVLAMRRAYAKSGLDPSTIDLIEAHATSTPIGDGTEIQALHEVYGEGRRASDKLPIGSVKGNIGHTRESAGAAGLLKAILALEHQTLPPTGNFREPSESIPWGDLAVEVQTTARPWTARRPGPRRAGVNAFGIGGLNFHVVVEEPPTKAQVASLGVEPRPLPALAIVGLGGRFPGAGSVGAFWERLVAGQDGFSEVPRARWDANIYHAPGDRRPFRTYAKRGGFITDYAPDWKRYKVPPRLVETNDPLQFLLLDSALDALEDAKLDLEKVDRKRIGVLTGTVFGSDYALALAMAIRATELGEVTAELAGRPRDAGLIGKIEAAVRRGLPPLTEDSSGSTSASALSSRIAKSLDLMGPTYTLDAACASSLLVIELARELLARGDVDALIVGGGDRAMRVQRYEAYCQFYAISRGDQPRPFDAGADGFLPGEGAASMVVKRLDDAVRDGDRIYAVIRGVGTSSDGEPKSLHKPSRHGLTLAMRRALAGSGVEPGDVGFVECHGGATPVGDATEVAAVREVYLGGAREAPLLVGSVKSNVGHAQGAAGMIALVKAALAVHHRTVPPSLGFRRPHEDHGFGDALAVNSTAAPLGAGGAVGVSAMGLGGINAHVLLAPLDAARTARAPTPPATSTRPDPVAPPDAARTARAPTPPATSTRPDPVAPPSRAVATYRGPTLAAAAERVIRGEAGGQGPAIVAIAHGHDAPLAAQRELAKASLHLPNGAQVAKKQGIFARAAAPSAGTVALLFSGQGSQYGGMMKALAAEIPAAGAVLTELDEHLARRGRPALSPIVFGREIPDDVFLVQASILAADLIAFRALAARGLRPAALTGHSYGDYPALVAAGAWTLEAALDATIRRAEAISAVVKPGGMAAVSASLAVVQEVLESLPGVGAVSPANVNAPKQTVLSGTHEALDRAIAAFERQGFEVRRLKVPGPFHSPLMAAARSHLRETLAAIPMRRPEIAFLSSVTGRFEHDPAAIRTALVDQLTQPVDFVSQIRTLVGAGHRVFVECGPRGVLAGLTEQILGGDVDADAITTDDPKRPGEFALARIEALMASREPEPRPTEGAAERPEVIPLFEGDEAEVLSSSPAFAEFWDRTRPSVQALVRSFYASSRPAKVEAPALEFPSVVPTETPVEASEAPVASSPAMAEAAPPAPTTRAGPIDRDEIQRFLIAALVEQTGYPAELLRLDADLEADLGIDTVKQAQVLGKVRDRYGLRAEGEKISLADFPTLSHILDYVVGKLATQGPAKPRRAIPTVDVTAQRSAPRPSEPPSSFASEVEPPTRAEPIRRGDTPPPAPPARPTIHLSEPLPSTPPTPRLSAVPGPARPTPRLSVERVTVPPVPVSTLPAEPVLVLELEGTAREIGRRHGEALKERILELMARYERFVGAEAIEKMSVPEATRRLPELFDEASLEELRGLAEAVGLPFPFVLAYNLDSALFPAFTAGCTQIVRRAAHNGGRLVHAANEDSPLLVHLGIPLPRVVQVRRRTDGPHPDRRTVLFGLAGQIAGVNAVNDRGLTVTSCTLLDGPPAARLPDGVPHPFLVKRIAETASDLDEAKAIVARTHRTGRWSLALSDAERDAALALGYDGAKVLFERPIEREWVGTNHAESGPAEGGAAPEHSVLRLRRARALAEGHAELDPEALKALLRDRFDLARDREVQHATMNTVRRVDNVMSLVVEPRARRLWVNDRVPGPGQKEPVRFVGVAYGREPAAPRRPTPAAEPDAEPEPAHLTPAADLERDAPAIAPVAEIMTRHVIRSFAEPVGPAVARLRSAGGGAIVVGEGPWADAVAAELAQRGLVPSRARTAAEARLGPATEALVFVTGGGAASPRPWTEDAAAPSRGALEIFRLVRAFATARPNGRLIAATDLGGQLGFGNAVDGRPDAGGLIGLLKAVRRELPEAAVKVVDFAASASADEVRTHLFAELDAGDPRVEVGVLRGRRFVLGLVPATAERTRTTPLPAAWLLTGGARGITATIAARLAALYRPRLVLFGRTELPPAAEWPALAALDETALEGRRRQLYEALARRGPVAPLEYRAATEALERRVEIARTLVELGRLGSAVEYHAVDVSDRARVAAALARARAAGPIEGLIHGAGVEESKALAKKTDALFLSTYAPKVDGLAHLLGLGGFRTVVGFSSVSGRFGGLGQADYSAANEAEAKLLLAYREAHPGVAAVAIDWPAWGEVGMAARGSARVVLERAGQRFMSIAEGQNHLVRELWAGPSEGEVVITDALPSLDLDHTLPSAADTARLAEADRARGPLVDLVLRSAPGHTVAERTIDETEPFLDQHRMGPVPILPAVIGLEMFAELLAPSETVGEAHILTPLKVRGRPVAVRLERRGDELRLSAPALRSDGLVLEPERVHLVAKVLPRGEPAAPPPHPPGGEAVPYRYLPVFDREPSSRVMFHGPVFHAVRGVVPGPELSFAELVAPPVRALVRRSPVGFRLPASLLDGCLQAAGLVARIKAGVVALPVGFGRVDVAPRAVALDGAPVSLVVRQHRVDAEHVESDLFAFDAGGPLLTVLGYRARAVPGL